MYGLITLLSALPSQRLALPSLLPHFPRAVSYYVFTLFISFCPASFGADTYANFSQLSQNEAEGVDYRILSVELAKPGLVIAPHGGRIEFATSEIAKALAGNQQSMYLFEGLKTHDNRKLHITSSHFDEPRAVQISEKALWAISVHGYRDDQEEGLEIGGTNHKLAAQVAKQLKDVGFQVTYPSVRFAGSSLKNIVNLAQYGGVQIEISSKLRQRLMANPEVLKRVIESINEAISIYEMSGL